MIRAIAVTWFVLLALATGISPAQADKRVALLIGNGAYENVSALDNPTNDAEDMEASLKALGFEVRRVANLGKAAMEAELADFADASAGADIAVVFYAGHGMEVDRQNYLIPIDAKLETDRRLRFETISLDDVLVSLEAVRGVRIVLLDACRNNPFSTSMQVSSQNRSIGRGLSRVEAPSGTLISFAAKEGRVADDGDGRNSPFTAALLANLNQPGVEIGFLFRKVRDSVLAATNGTQEPYVSASLPGNAIFLIPPLAEPQPGPGPVAGDPTPTAPVEPASGGASPTPPATAEAADPGGPLRPGEAVVTRFSGVVDDPAGGARSIIDPGGTVAATVDLRTPGAPPQGQRLSGVTQRSAITAADVGQVFGTAIAATEGAADIYLAATSAFGLHRTPDNSGWMPGLWGEQGGPGTIWVMREKTGYQPELFADITLDQRANSGAALGNLAVDRRNRQLFVSDLETGMIHRLSLDDGAELGRFDHGVEGRSAFFDVPTGLAASLPVFGFDPASAARIDNCPSDDFAATPSCWNYADFRRRIWGLAVRNDATSGTTRLYYATWGSEGFVNPDWAGAGDDQRNAVWSIGIGLNGDFDRADMRREFYLPDFFTTPETTALYGPSNPVADIAFSACGAQDTMLVAERGGIRNLGLGAEAPFARPHDSRVLRYERGPDGDWKIVGRYDAGNYDRVGEGPPHIRSNAAGGVAFGPGFDANWRAGAEIRNGMVWASGDALCSPSAACFAPGTGEFSDVGLLHGIQGAAPELFSEVAPAAANQSYPSDGPASPAQASSASFMVAISDDPGIKTGMIGGIAVYQPCPEGELPPAYDVAEVDTDQGWPEDTYPDAPFPEDAFPDDYDPGVYPDDPGGWEGWEPRFDLAITKTGAAECQEGVVCAYQVKVENHGPDVYAGPLAVSDKMPPGALFNSVSPGWTCNAFLGTAYCVRNSHVALAPSAVDILDISLKLPIHVPGNAVQNCARMDWDAIGIDDGAGDGNDLSCVVTPIADHFDLGIAKASQSATCGVGGECFSVIEVTNHGPGEFSGKLVVAETLPANTTLASVSGEWGCSQSGPALSCLRPKKLIVGESVTLTLGLIYPLETPDGALENCARIDFGAMDSDDGNADVAPDQACDSVDIHHDGFDLAISKIGPSQCDDGGLCRYEIEITNNGPNNFANGLAFVDARPVGATIASGPGAGWGCLLGDGPEEIKCTLPPAVLAPGESRIAKIDYQLPLPVGAETIESCASLDWSAMPLDLPGDTNDQSCAKTNIGDGFDLVVDKTGPAECVEGAVCDYVLTVENAGPRPFEGTLALTDALPDDATVVSASPGWTCAPTVIADEFACHSNGDVTILAGATATLELGVRLPDTVIVDTIENCTSLDLPEMGFSSDADAANDGPACATNAVLDADVALFGGTTCKIGAPCNLSVTMRNDGGRAFEGILAINGSLDPEIAIQTVVPPGAGWFCEVTGLGTYRCGRTNSLRLEPGEARKLRLVTSIPADFAASHVAHRMWLTWPQAGKRDRNAGNDANVSFVRIEQAAPTSPPEPAPEPDPQADPDPVPEPPAARPELAMTKTGPAECVLGRDCTWSIRVMNNGPGAYAGVLFVDDSPPGGESTALVRSSGGWTCGQAGGGISCRRDFTTLAAGQSVGLDLTLRLPSSADAFGGLQPPDTAVQNCAAIMRPIGARPRGMRAEAGAVYAIQHALAIGGYLSTSGVDGLSGPATRAAIARYQRANGLDETGVADERTVQIMMPVISRVIGDDVGENDADCATTKLVGIVPPAPTCAPDERWTGRSCVPICRADQRWDGGRCLPRCTSGERWTGRSCVPICRDGESWNGRQCVAQCKSGQRWDGQRCVSLCGRGESWNGRQCVAQCKSGQRWDGQRCVSLCGRGESWNGRQCVAQCKSGQRWDGKSCVSICQRNQRFDPRTGRCLPILTVPDRVTPQPSRPNIPLRRQPQIQLQQIPQGRLQQLQPQLPLQQFK